MDGAAGVVGAISAESGEAKVSGASAWFCWALARAVRRLVSGAAGAALPRLGAGVLGAAAGFGTRGAFPLPLTAAGACSSAGSTGPAGSVSAGGAWSPVWDSASSSAGRTLGCRTAAGRTGRPEGAGESGAADSCAGAAGSKVHGQLRLRMLQCQALGFAFFPALFRFADAAW